MTMIDVSHLPVLDVHAHPFLHGEAVSADQLADLVAFSARQSYLTEGGIPDTAESRAEMQRMFRNTVYHRRMVRDLAGFFGCEPTLEAVIAARTARIVAVGYTPYVGELFGAVQLRTIVFDMGFPQPPVPLAGVQAQLPVEIVPIYRIEPLIAELLKSDCGWSEFQRRYEEAIVSALTSGGYRGLKSIIAYRTGLDVSPLSRTADQGMQALDAIRRGLGGGSMKKLRDHLLCRALELAIAHDVPMQIHTGMGDYEVNLPLCRPSYLMDLLRFPVYRACRVLLVHGGYPYTREAGYMAGVLPRVYLDLSEGIPFAGGAARSIVAEALEMTPLHKICYGSDGYSVPEINFTSALAGKQAVARALDDLVADGLLGAADAQQAAGLILAGNGRELYQLDR